MADFKAQRNSMHETTNQLAWSLSDPTLNEARIAAEAHQRSAELMSPTTYWTGTAKRSGCGPYSKNVFVYQIPNRLTTYELQKMFDKYGENKCYECTGSISKNNEGESPLSHNYPQKKGMVSLVFEHQESITKLLQSCTPRIEDNQDYILPPAFGLNYCGRVSLWSKKDCIFYTGNPEAPNQNLWVFVRNAPRNLSALTLTQIMSDRFGDVVWVRIITDDCCYPNGHAIVAFTDIEGFVNAVNTGVIGVQSQYFNQNLLIDPYVRSQSCTQCSSMAVLFCRNAHCFSYYCAKHWKETHEHADLTVHVPLFASLESRQAA